LRKASRYLSTFRTIQSRSYIFYSGGRTTLLNLSRMAKFVYKVRNMNMAWCGTVLNLANSSPQYLQTPTGEKCIHFLSETYYAWLVGPVLQQDLGPALRGCYSNHEVDRHGEYPAVRLP
jgi:hypothetical protein